jgi:NAD(P)-dependent dehydrogenase (short-subunit alcohol dehydrogenase family)
LGGVVVAERRGVAVVSGGSAGVGREVVRHLARRGWDVAVLARGEAGGAAAVDEVVAAGGRGLSVVVDVAHAEEVEAAAERVEKELGRSTRGSTSRLSARCASSGTPRTMRTAGLPR